MRRIVHSVAALVLLLCGAASARAGPIPNSLWIGADPFNSSTGILNTDRLGNVLRSADPFGNGGIGNGIAVDVAGNLIYFSDEGVQQKANLSTLANIGGPIPQSPGGSLPEDMTFDSVNRVIYRTDYGLGLVNRIDPATNTVLSSFSVAGSRISGPVGIAYDGTGLWVSGFNNNTIERFTLSGVDTGVGFALAANFIGQGFSNAGGLGYDTTDNTLWIGTGNRVYHYDLAGNQLGFFATPEFNTGRIRFVDGLEFEGPSSNPVPEPSGLVLLATVSVGLLGYVRRGRKFPA
jgi:hypothetical protein